MTMKNTNLVSIEKKREGLVLRPPQTLSSFSLPLREVKKGEQYAKQFKGYQIR